MRLLVGSDAHNAHVQHMVRALHESGRLYEFVSRGVDSYRTPGLRALRGLAGSVLPPLNRALAHRRVDGIPRDRIRARWGWELVRLAAGTSGLTRVEDWAWEHGEHALDACCARLLSSEDVGGFLGIQHGALASLRRARTLGKPGLLAFLSPHHATRLRLVGAEYARDPSLGSKVDRHLQRLGEIRDRRVDDEVRTASWIITGSSFTTRSLIAAGVDAQKIVTVPLGGPAPVDAARLPAAPARPVRFICAGNVSVLKGAHYLLRAWSRLRPVDAELHFYGKELLPRTQLMAWAGDACRSVTFHGAVAPGELHSAFLSGSVLVFPTLCDGFGQVVTEALAHGLPVIATRNAGAADAVVPNETGWVIAAADEDALVERLEWCASHRMDLFAMRPRALASAAANTWDSFRVRFNAAIDESIGHPVRVAS